jgi:hypothetical protein
MGFEPTIAVLERAKTVRALDRSATAIGSNRNEYQKISNKVSWEYSDKQRINDER